jgi:hypothetical protein
MAAFEPARVDFDLWRGNNVPPLTWGMEDDGGGPVPFAGSVFSLRVSVRGATVLSKRSDAGDGLLADPATSELTWTPTLAESRLVPAGRRATYEIERHIGGSQETWVVGSITGKGGFNDDE